MAQVYDLIIVGGGGAGLAAAWCALEGGIKKILVVESLKKTGGNSALAGGFVYAVETEQLKKKGNGPTVTEALKNHLNFHHYDLVEPRQLRHWLDETKHTIKWMEDLGLPFSLSTMGSGCSHLMEGSNWVACFWKFLTPLAQKLKDRGVEILTSTSVLSIQKDGSGRVSGVIAVKEDGKEERFSISGRNVLIASGGFLSREDLMDKYFSLYYNKKVKSPHLSTRGNGIEIAISAGGRISSECTLVKENGRHSAPGVVFVNSDGRRYQDESLWHNNYSANALLKQPGMMGYAIFSKSVLDDMSRSPGPPGPAADQSQKNGPMSFNSDWGSDNRPEKKLEFALRNDLVNCNSVEEMAAFIGCEARVLQKTIDDYNGYCKEGIDREMGKDTRYLKLLSGPWGVDRILPTYVDTIGPVVVDENMRVQDNNQKVIPGLYAAGVITAGWVGRDYYQFGSALSYALTSGRIAGMTIARDFISSG
jgi:fumarate reductase flavoprotein subunit